LPDEARRIRQEASLNPVALPAKMLRYFGERH
jgi:hypothetical protein